jgi:hypothetical protein
MLRRHRIPYDSYERFIPFRGENGSIFVILFNKDSIGMSMLGIPAASGGGFVWYYAVELCHFIE